MSLGRRLTAVPLEDLVFGFAASAVGLFLVWSATRIGDITAPMYANSDIASAPVLAQLLPDQGSGHLVLGYYPWLESLLALDLTRWVPSHVTFWKAAPFFVYGATVVLAGWTVARTVSLKTGVLVALAMAAPAPLVIYLLGSPDQRLPELAHAVLLAAFLVTAPLLVRWGWLRRSAWAVALAVTLAPGVASDPLVVPAAVLPFLATVLIGWRLRLLPAGAAAVAGGACAAGALGGLALLRIAEHHRIVYSHPVWGVASPGEALSHGWLLLKEMALLAHGWFDTAPAPVDSFAVARIGVGVAAIAVVIALLLSLVWVGRGFLIDLARPATTRLLAVYWGVSALAVSAVFIGTTVPAGLSSVRYVFTLWPALLSLAALVYGRRAHIWLASLVVVTSLVGCWELQRGLYTTGVVIQPTPAEVARLQRIAASHHLDHGYAGYWDAMPITLDSDFKLRAYPIEPCGASGYCPFHLHVIESWYRPKPGTRTFYVVGNQTLMPPLGPPPKAWGAPSKVLKVGHLTVYLFNYDIATRLLPFKAGGLSAPERQPRS